MRPGSGNWLAVRRRRAPLRGPCGRPGLRRRPRDAAALTKAPALASLPRATAHAFAAGNKPDSSDALRLKKDSRKRTAKTGSAPWRHHARTFFDAVQRAARSPRRQSIESRSTGACFTRETNACRDARLRNRFDRPDRRYGLATATPGALHQLATSCGLPIRYPWRSPNANRRQGKACFGRRLPIAAIDRKHADYRPANAFRQASFAQARQIIAQV